MSTDANSDIEKVCSAAARANSLDEETRKADREAFSVLQSEASERCASLQLSCHMQNPKVSYRSGGVVYHVEILLKQASGAPSTSILQIHQLLRHIPLSTTDARVATIDTTNYDEATNSFLCKFDFPSAAPNEQKKPKAVLITAKRTPTSLSSSSNLRSIKKPIEKTQESIRPKRLHVISAPKKKTVEEVDDEIADRELNNNHTDDSVGEQSTSTPTFVDAEEKKSTQKNKKVEKTSWWSRLASAWSRTNNNLSEEDKKAVETFEFQPSLFVVDG